MAFFENFGKRVSEAAQAAAKKSSELMEVTKINMNIAQEEDRIKKLYTSIGKKVYESYLKDPGMYVQFKEECTGIDSHNENIKKMKARILEAKNLRLCSGCGEEIGVEVVYCPKCGAKQEPVNKPEGEEPPRDQVPVCPSCGTEITQDAAFCPSCGAKLK
jgi:predicted RNA-binding Zn-ribbon protein involved in translation (DUF1610 family)